MPCSFTGWCITARAAVNLPFDRPEVGFGSDDYDDFDDDFGLRSPHKTLKDFYANQTPTATIMKRFKHELERLESIVKVGDNQKSERSVVGEWDRDRARWLEQWVRNLDMV